MSVNQLALAKWDVPDEFLQLPAGRSVFFVTNNASWNVERFLDKRTFFISIAPQRSEAVTSSEVFPPAEIWRAPFILSHEFGHHIFFNLIEGDKPLSNETLAALSDQRNYANESTMPLHPRVLVADSNLVLAGFSEGFADLMGLYLSGGYGLGNANCFGKGRDPGTDTFTSGRKKELSKEFVEHLFFGVPESLGSEESIPACKKAGRDSHTLGAILAHGFEKLVSIELADKTIRLSADAASARKLQIALSWLKEVSKERDMGREGPLSFLENIALSLKVAIKAGTGNPTLSPAGEKVFTDLFSGLNLVVR